MSGRYLAGLLKPAAPASTNLIPSPDDMTDTSYWQVNGAGSGIDFFSPGHGPVPAFEYTSGGNGSDIRTLNPITLSSGADYNFSVVLRTGYTLYRWARILINGQSTWVDMVNGVLGTSGHTGATLTLYEEAGTFDWWTLAFPFTAVGSNTDLLVLLSADDADTAEKAGAFYLGDLLLEAA